MAKTNPMWVFLILFLMMFHGCVIKAQRILQVRECYTGSYDKAHEECVARITYFSALKDLKTVFHAWD